jgi:sortase A
MRRPAGLALIVLGGVLLSFAGARYALGAARQDEARRAWDQGEAQAAVEAAREGAFGRAVEGRLTEGAPVARLQIPRLGVDEIVVEGVSDGALNTGPGHYRGSALPGERGNSIISAHRDRHFSGLDGLRVGDTITTQTRHKSHTWVVSSRRIVDRAAPALFRTDEPTLTLTTCWPIRFLGTAPDRLIVTAIPIQTSVKPAG